MYHRREAEIYNSEPIKRIITISMPYVPYRFEIRAGNKTKNENPRYKKTSKET